MPPARFFVFFFQAEDGIRDRDVTGVKTCALPIFRELPELGVHVEIHRGGLEAFGIERVDDDSSRIERGADVAVGQDHRPWMLAGLTHATQIGRASCRERAWGTGGEGGGGGRGGGG